METIKSYADYEQLKKLADLLPLERWDIEPKETETVYACGNCPHAGNLMCCHNCPNF